MRRTLLSRTVLLAVLASLAGFQLVGLITALVSASRERVTDFGIVGPNLGGYSHLARIRRISGLPVDSVYGPALAAGLERGDVITRIDGVPMTERPGVWYAGRFNTPPGTDLRLTVRRDGRTFETVLHTTRLAAPLRMELGGGGPDAPRMDYRAYHWWAWGPNLLLATLLFVVGLTIGVLRINDAAAWTFALVFLGVSLATSVSADTPLLHVWPPWLVVFWSLCVILGIGYSMPLSIQGLMRFPDWSGLSRRLWPWRWVPWVVIGGAAALEMALALIRNSGHAPASLVNAGRIADFALNFALAFGFTSMAIVLVAHRFEPPSTRGERLKVLKVLWNGAMCAVAGGLWSTVVPDEFWYWITRPLGTAGIWIGQTLEDLVPALLVCMLPLSFAYTILARRLFGIRFVIRRGLQHLLLSRGVLLVEGVLLFLGLETLIRHTTVVGAVRGPALAGVLALIAVSGIALINRPLMQALDRRFFRDRYDARRVMLGLGQDLGQLRERDEILKRTGETILAAIHPARVGIFLRGKDGTLSDGWISDETLGRVADETAALAQRLSVTEGDVWLKVEPPATADRPIADGTYGIPDTPAPTAAPYEVCIPLRQARRISGCIALAAKQSDEPYTAEDRELLVTVANQAALALENADLLAVAKREAQYSRDVEIARQVQSNLFPRELPQIPGWEVAAVCLPARSVAGDYYDVVTTAGDELGVALGDVSGKGVGASLLSAGVHAMVRSRLPARACDLGVLLQDLNAHLLESSADDMFATVVVARISPADGRLVYVNGGHPPPLVMTTGGARWLNDGGPLVGVLPKARYVPGESRLEPGDLLMIYSDGVTEAERPGGEMFGEERLLAAMKGARGASAPEAMAALLRAVEEFTGGAEQADDISIVVVRRM
ncbi:MAG TPA: SpoIIE family protein phosphatase [Candidatus Eisenbacteria bacterium]|nr:SpoIIE family protein phosphatase [Candidatus Eisenbacteria bacterium]